MDLPLPWAIYLALFCFGTSGILDLIMWQGVRFCLRTDPSEVDEMCRKTPKLGDAMLVLSFGNRVLMLGTMFCSAWAIVSVTPPITEFNPITWVTTLVISIPLIVFAWLFFKIWTQLHEALIKARTGAAEVHPN